MQYLKTLAVVIGGFFFTLLTTSYSVIGSRILFPEKKTPSASPPDVFVNIEPATRSTKAFSDQTAKLLRATTAFTMGAALVSRTLSLPFANAVTTVFLLSTTLNNFVFGARQPKSFTKVVHPLVTTTVMTWSFMWVTAKCLSITFHDMLRTYSTSAGPVLLGFLGPAVASLSCQMYERRKLMRDNIKQVVTAVLVSALGGLFGTALAVRFLQIGNPALRLSLLSRNITSPLAMSIAKILGADVSLAVSMVVVTGLFGANFGANILSFFSIRDPVARGMGIGAAAHGLGTAAFANEKNAFPFAAVAMALTASVTTVLVSIPLVKTALLKVALGW